MKVSKSRVGETEEHGARARVEKKKNKQAEGLLFYFLFYFLLKFVFLLLIITTLLLSLLLTLAVFAKASLSRRLVCFSRSCRSCSSFCFCSSAFRWSSWRSERKKRQRQNKRRRKEMIRWESKCRSCRVLIVIIEAKQKNHKRNRNRSFRFSAGVCVSVFSSLCVWYSVWTPEFAASLKAIQKANQKNHERTEGGENWREKRKGIFPLFHGVCVSIVSSLSLISSRFSPYWVWRPELASSWQSSQEAKQRSERWHWLGNHEGRLTTTMTRKKKRKKRRRMWLCCTQLQTLPHHFYLHHTAHFAPLVLVDAVVDLFLLVVLFLFLRRMEEGAEEEEKDEEEGWAERGRW